MPQHDLPRLDRSRSVGRRLAELVPGGAHTYAKGEDQYPAGLAPVITRGQGARVWDVDGNEYVEFGSGLRSVVLGHGHPEVLEAVHTAIDAGTNFVRPSMLELAAAEAFLDRFSRADMVKFTKNGSDATTAAVRLARAVTGRDVVAVCKDQPFFSTDDWFISTTPMGAGIPEAVAALTRQYPYGDLAALEAAIGTGDVACVVSEAATVVEPPPGYWAGVRALCDRYGTLLVLDEMITGFRWHAGGAQEAYDIHPDLAAFGKALGNGFAVSALAGKRDFMERGGLRTDHERVFLLSTTHGAEASGLAAAQAVLHVFGTEPVVEKLEAQGRQLADGVRDAAQAAGIEEYLLVRGRPANLVYATLDSDNQPSQEMRTLFLQELIRGGVLAPSFVVSAALTDVDLERTLAAVSGACRVYAQALEDGPYGFLSGRPVKPVFRPYA